MEVAEELVGLIGVVVVSRRSTTPSPASASSPWPYWFGLLGFDREVGLCMFGYLVVLARVVLG